MIRSVRLIVLSFILAAFQLSSLNGVAGVAGGVSDTDAVNVAVSPGDLSDMSSGLIQCFSRYSQEPLWRQTSLFPRWNDTYVVVFEQKMLA